MELNGRVIEGLKYKTLNDARVYEPILAKGNGKVKIWHLKSFDNTLNNDIMRDLHFGIDKYTIPALEQVAKENKKYWGELGAINLPNKSSKHRTALVFMEDVFRAMQSDFWSPYGEASELIEEKSVHTSMSIGDLITIESDILLIIKTYIVADIGFKEVITDKNGKVTLGEVNL